MTAFRISRSQRNAFFAAVIGLPLLSAICALSSILLIRSLPRRAQAVQVAQPAATAYYCPEIHGQVIDESFNSATAGGAVPYRVYLPPCYTQTNRRYPVAILLHGAGDDQTEWTDGLGVNTVLDAGIDNGTLPPMILIMPYGGELEYSNDFSTAQTFETFILGDLLPEIVTHYCAWNAQAGRALAGISRGGFWAFEIGLRHPEVFGALAGHSAYFDSSTAAPEYNPLDLAQTIPLNIPDPPRLWLDVGPDDADTKAGLDSLAQVLTVRGIDPGYTVYPTGGHTSDYWKAHLADYLAFYGKEWPRDPMALQPCTV